MHKYWHYVDRPYAIDGLQHGDAPSPHAETQMAVFGQGIGSDQPDALKCYDLVWLMHLVGDVTKPFIASRDSTDGTERRPWRQ